MAVPLFLLMLVALAGIQPAGAQTSSALPPSVQLPPELARVLTDYEAAFARGGVALAPIFADDGFVLPSGRAPVRGRAAIAEYYGAGRGQLLFLRAFAYAQDGTVGYILGGYTFTRGGADEGKFTLTLRKASDGKWLIASDMDNTNTRR